MEDASSRFTKEVLSQMRRDVKNAGGNEVFWSGKIDSKGIIVSVKVGARGNEESVIVNQDAAREGNVLIHNHPSGILYPSNADQNIAMNASDSSSGFYIVNNEVDQVYVVVEAVLPKVIVPLDAEETALFLSKGGSFSEQDSAFEERQSQIELLKNICRAFNEEKIGVFEAGTGVGKSFAYLIPSMLWALKNRERVVISTGTINLQQQLMEKDIPAACKIIGKKIKAVLVKGRQNYVCLRRLGEAGNERDLFSEDTDVFDRIADWAKVSESGSRSDLAFMPPENVWSRINSESDACMGSRCPYREKCFVMKTRKEASEANLIVVNHHLLFADIESRMSGVGYDDAAVLPPYRRIVFDEAHGIEDSATSFFSEGLNRFRVVKQLNLMYRQKRTAMAGLLIHLEALSNAEEYSARASSDINLVREKLILLDECAQEAMNGSLSERICRENAAKYQSVFNAMNEFSVALGETVSCLRTILEGIAEDDRDLPVVWESKTVLRRLEDTLTVTRNFISWDESEDKVFWLERKRLPSKNAGDESVFYVQFNQTPLDISHMMNEGVFEPMKSVICTSATLRTGNTFSYWMKRTGISLVEKERVLQGEFLSPFPYSTNMLFAVPRDAPSLVTGYAFQEYIEKTIPRLIKASGGRTLVLFTSYDSLKNAYEYSCMALESYGYRILRQGQDDRFRLLSLFKEDSDSVLFATDSFWEGVDVPGESLSQVIIVKLPFAVPNDPVFAARSELIDKRGGSSFAELSVPQAVIKFRQGFGRLIRKSDDRGILVVLDKRIVEKSYGKTFTKSVPETRRMFNPLNDIIRAEELFFSN